MAINANVFSGKEFKVYVNTDKVGTGASAGVGHFNDTADSAWKTLDVDSVTLPTFSPNQEFEMRTGSGRMATFEQVFSSSKRVITEFSLSGRVTTQDLPILVENVIGGEAGTSDPDGIVAVATAYNPQTLQFDDSGADSTDIAAGEYSKTLSFYFQAADGSDSSSAKSYKLAGCICTSLTLSAEMGTASGRFNFDATFQTSHAASQGSVDMSSAATYGSTNLFLSDLDNRSIGGGGTGFSGLTNEPLFNSFSCTIENPVQFLGATGSNAEPQVIARAVPELGINFSGSIKYDSDTVQLVEVFRDITEDKYINLFLSNEAKSGSTFETASSGIGFNFLKAKLTSCEVSGDDVAGINFEGKALDPGSGNAVEILVV